MADGKKKQCFVISQIGEEDGPERVRSDQVLRHIVAPVVAECGYDVPVRADSIGRPGLISKQIVDSLCDADLVVADLTGKNANVFYELAIRHAVRKPLVQLMDHKEKLPFDLLDTRTIKFNYQDLDSVDDCKKKLKVAILEVENDPSKVDNPLSAAIDLRGEGADPLRRLTEKIDEMGSAIREIQSRLAPPLAAIPTISGSLANDFGKEVVARAVRDISGATDVLRVLDAARREIHPPVNQESEKDPKKG